MTPPSKTVLIVEDEILVREIAATILSNAGFEVIEADHAAAALAIMRSQAADISLLFTDIRMPGEMNGLKLAHHVKQAWPEIPILITSGDKRPQSEQLPPGSHFCRGRIPLTM